MADRILAPKFIENNNEPLIGWSFPLALSNTWRQYELVQPRASIAAIVSSVMTTDYVGHEGLQRFEVLTYQVFDDVYQDAERRCSEDNGRTWTAWAPDAEADIVRVGDSATSL